ncbi:MAG: helix-turn-helix domain-containing protein [Pseudomonadota bacterium]
MVSVARHRPAELQSCEDCGIGRLCLSSNLLGGNLQELKPFIGNQFTVQRRERLFDAYSPQRALYVVRAGSFKTCEIDADGDEQVLEFYLPGDVLGLEDLLQRRHRADAVALEESSICTVPLDRFGQDDESDSIIFREMFSVMCCKLGEQRQLIHQLGKADATARLASFLLHLSDRLAERNLPARQFRLSMGRTDIASYLRSTLETASRSFSALQREGFIHVRGKNVQIIDDPAMRERFLLT